MRPLVLITGGAGFIGTHTARLLLERGWHVRVLDNLCAQVHGETPARPPHLPDGVELVRGDVTDRQAVAAALRGVTSVLHLAALTGVTQSMHEIKLYIDTNASGTGCLWDVIVNDRLRLDNFVLASSRAVYGEGVYRCACQPGDIHPPPRAVEMLARGQWDPICAACGAGMTPAPTPETLPPAPLSVYALSKVYQEQLCHLMAGLTGTPLVTLRYFNVYGSHQAMSNPYTGIAPAFCTQLLLGQPAALYEDGLAIRDFIHVRDVAEANWLALNYHGPRPGAFNIGSGAPVTIKQLADVIAAALGVRAGLAYTGRYRVGDIRGCFADTERATADLGFRAAVGLDQGMADLTAWARRQTLAAGKFEAVAADLARRGLVHTVQQAT